MFRSLSPLLLALLLSTAPRAAELAETQCEVVRGRLLVPAQLDGQGPFPFLLDAGLRQPVLTPEAVTFLNLTPGRMPEYPGVDVVEVAAFAPASLPAQASILLVSPLGDLAERLGYRVAGLLPLHQPGYEIILNVHAATVRWRGLADAALDKTVASAIPLRLAENGQPQVQALFNGEFLVPVQIDLNYGDTLTLPADVAATLVSEAAPRFRTRLAGGGMQEQIRLDSMEIGHAKLLHALCTLGPEGSAARVGLAWLRHYEATFNLEYGRLQLQRAGDAPVADPAIVGFGLALARQMGGFWTVHVAENSPAAEAGLLPGDQLAAIGGQSLENVSYEGAMRLLDAPAGAGASVTWLRGDHSETAELIARPLF